MATQEVKIINSVIGKDQIAENQRLIAALKDDVVHLSRAYTSVGAALADPAILARVQNIGMLEKGIKDTRRQMGGFFSEVGHGSFNLTSFAHIVDDAQYSLTNFSSLGLRGVANNLVMLSPALGLAAIGIDILIRGIRGYMNMDWNNSDSPFLSELERIDERIKEINSKDLKLRVDRAELAHLKDVSAQIGRATKVLDEGKVQQTSGEAGAAGQLDAFMQNQGGNDAREAFRRQMRAQFLKNPDLDEARAKQSEHLETMRLLSQDDRLQAGGNPVKWVTNQLLFWNANRQSNRKGAEAAGIEAGAVEEADRQTNLIFERIKTNSGKELEAAIKEMAEALVKGGMDAPKAKAMADDIATEAKQTYDPLRELVAPTLQTFSQNDGNITKAQENVKQLEAFLGLLDKIELSTRQRNEAHRQTVDILNEQKQAAEDFQKSIEFQGLQNTRDYERQQRQEAANRRDAIRERGESRTVRGADLASRIRAGASLEDLTAELEAGGLERKDAAFAVLQADQDAQDQSQARKQARKASRRSSIAGALTPQARMLGLGRAINNASLRGEDADETDSRLRQQVMGRFGVDAETAQQMVDQTRGEFEQYDDQMAGARAAMGPMADPRVRMAMMAKGAFGRAGIAQHQMATDGGIMGRAGRQMAARREQMRQKGIANQWEQVEKWLGPEAAAQLRGQAGGVGGPGDAQKDPVVRANEDLTKQIDGLKEEIVALRQRGLPAIIKI